MDSMAYLQYIIYLSNIITDKNENVLKIVFDNNVYLTKTSFLHGIPSLLIGLGGAISGGRTLLWFIAAALGIFKIAEKLKHCFCAQGMYSKQTFQITSPLPKQ